MRIPELHWDRRHNVARLTVSFSGRIWHRREIGDVVLGYNATGRLARIVVLDPARMLPENATERDAIVAVRETLDGALRPADLEVLKSALDRAR